ncbi:MAG TPA: molybdopterin-dependent oxidoreductase Mo/Fe-S-binding subunit [Rectinemataceae bacterium]|nr:molybdopterin-dependent oxidoreductase Mo/Fe-S-binding subunit [Rectinemataceae bacterium]
MILSFTLNGKAKRWDCEPGTNLRDLLRSKGIVSVRNGCDGEGSCGLCAVIMDGKLVNSCMILAAEAEGKAVYAVEPGFEDPILAIAQRSLIDAHCVQCGYCTPAVSLALSDLLSRSPEPSDDEVRDALSGTLCRCTGYQQFLDAAHLASRRLSDPSFVAEAGPSFKPELRHIGKDREKVDARSLARGERAFVEDRVASDSLHLKILGSPHAHAFVKSVDASAALAMPGVVAVVHTFNCPDKVYTTAGQGFPEPSPHDQRMFSRKVRFVGDRVAAVLAESPAEAKAALSAIKVEYEVLEPVLSMAQAKAPGAPVIHAGDVVYVAGEAPAGSSTRGDGRDDSITYQFPIGADPHRNLAASAHGGIGDIEAGFAEADVIIERTYRGNRVQSTPLEPHVVYARVDGGRLVLHASTQVSWHVRRIVSRVVGIPENKVRVIKERVGGGFGAKQDIVVEDIAGWLAWTTSRPVFFRYSREEEFQSSRTRHAMDIRVKMGAKRDGTLTAIDMHVDADTGPYGQHCLTVPMNAVSKSLPLLICPNARFTVDSWYTNLSVAGAYQGYGAPKGSFAIQACLAELAAELGIDQLEMIEKNRVRSGTRIEILKSLGEGREGAAVDLGECGLGEMIARGKKAFNWEEKGNVRAGKRSGTEKIEHKGEGDWKRGRGAVIVQQGSGLPGLDAANAEIRLLADGTLLMLSGGADLGTGLDTVTAKAAAEVMGLDMEDVAVVSGDTDLTPFDKGAYASSGTYFSGNAALKAAEDLRSKVLAAAAEMLGEPVANLRIAHRGRIVGSKGELKLSEIAHRTVEGEGFGELSGFGSFKTLHAAFPYGAHFAEVLVNGRTGEVKLERFHVYQDCGTPINPALAKGQIFGGVMKAVGHSLYEELLFDDKGRCINPRFLDYKIPSINEVPRDFVVELVPVEDEIGPFGAKSVSEISLNGAAPAIAIAIHDALGIWVREYPFTPERILRALGKLPGAGAMGKLPGAGKSAVGSRDRA